jgi:hypothetical protein
MQRPNPLLGDKDDKHRTNCKKATGFRSPLENALRVANVVPVHTSAKRHEHVWGSGGVAPCILNLGIPNRLV